MATSWLKTAQLILETWQENSVLMISMYIAQHPFHYLHISGCVDVHGRTENRKSIENTLCLCDTDLCNETDQNGAFNLAPKFVSIVLTFALTFLILNWKLSSIHVRRYILSEIMTQPGVIPDVDSSAIRFDSSIGSWFSSPHPVIRPLCCPSDATTTCAVSQTACSNPSLRLVSQGIIWSTLLTPDELFKY